MRIETPPKNDEFAQHIKFTMTKVIDTGKYLKPLGRVSRHVNNQAYEARFHLLSPIIKNTPNFQEQ